MMPFYSSLAVPVTYIGAVAALLEESGCPVRAGIFCIGIPWLEFRAPLLILDVAD